LEAVNLALEDKGLVYTIDEIRFTLDMQSFFEFYKVINAKALSERIGMNQSLSDHHMMFWLHENILLKKFLKIYLHVLKDTCN
jgi:hypothetical protein